MTSERVYTVPWFPQLAGVHAHGLNPGQQLNGQSVGFTMMVAILSRKMGPLPPVLFGIALGDLFNGLPLPPDLATGLARGAVLTARALGLIEERDGMVAPSETLMRTQAWWES